MIKTRTGISLLAGLFASACASNTVSFYGENDAISYGPPGDANYTNGIQLSIIPKEGYEPCDGGSIDFEDDPCITTKRYKKVLNWLNFLEQTGQEARDNPAEYAINLEYGFGQQIYTPDDISISVVQPLDRPYAGWLFGFLKIHNDRAIPGDEESDWRGDRRLSVTTKIGMVGPSSQASALQKYWHEEVCDCTYPNGWHLQVRDEVGFVVAAAREDRLWVHEFNPYLKADAMWRGELSLGNVYTGADVGGSLRVGFNLPREFAPITIGPQRLGGSRSLEEATSWRDAISIYAFVGGIGRLVGRDIFLDGNTFKTSPHTVDKEPFYAEGQIGIGAQYKRWSLRVLYAHRSDQFETQRKSHRFGSATITSRFR